MSVEFGGRELDKADPSRPLSIAFFTSFGTAAGGGHWRIRLTSLVFGRHRRVRREPDRDAPASCLTQRLQAVRAASATRRTARRLISRGLLWPAMSTGHWMCCVYLSFIRTKTGGTVQIAHGPPSTENSTKSPYKSIRAGQNVAGARIEPTARPLFVCLSRPPPCAIQ